MQKGGGGEKKPLHLIVYFLVKHFTYTVSFQYLSIPMEYYHLYFINKETDI